MTHQPPAEPLLSQRVAAELRAELARRQWSGRRLAEVSDTPFKTAARHLSGGSAIPVDALARYARALDITAIELMRRADGHLSMPASA